MPTEQQCKKMLFNLGLKLGVSPALISTRLLSDEDKQDMLSGLLSTEVLEVAIVAWMADGLPDYTNGSTTRYKPSCDKPMSRYRGIGKN